MGTRQDTGNAPGEENVKLGGLLINRLRIMTLNSRKIIITTQNGA